MTGFATLTSSEAIDPAFELTDNGLKTDKGRVYRFSPMVEAAVDVAIGLRRPLLVAGEPGSGKTELGYAVARRLRIDTLYFFSTKSTSEAGDLFYTYDAVGRFREAQLAAVRAVADEKLGRPFREPDVGQYVHYQALGRAILDAHQQRDIAGLLPGGKRPDRPTGPLSTTYPRQSVVIIDEIDKAPRDFTNDLLREIEDLSFRVPELGGSNVTPAGSTIPSKLRPIIIATSNEESQMPDAFLRRCAFLALEFPNEDQLREILDLHLGGSGPGRLDGKDRDILVTKFVQLRKQGMQKNAGVAELIDAGRVLAGRPAGEGVEAWLQRLGPALVKLKPDLGAFDAVFPGSRAGAASGAG